MPNARSWLVPAARRLPAAFTAASHQPATPTPHRPRRLAHGGVPSSPPKQSTLYKQMAALTKSAATGELGRTLGVGGADEILVDLVRRVFSTRLLPSESVKKYGLRHIRGILLHGPPGTGKTLVARKVSRRVGS